ncbi:MAG: hypothetical protein HOH19_08650 [Kordiimonadaceae bacterium]|nr:hypothetical protein [Kordiimonadaceae bacterium]MBT6032631.1 hypothetical protein [Kordiimonadaceae bacterium]
MTFKILLIAGMACTLITGQSYAQEAQTNNKNKLNNNVEQNNRAAIHLEIKGIKGESTKRVSPGDCDDTDPDCKSLIKRPGTDEKAAIHLEIKGIKGESTKRVSPGDCDDTDPDCKSLIKRPGTDEKAANIKSTPPQ